MSGAVNRAPFTVLILAAGLGKRMNSRVVKLLHPVAGRPMVAHVGDAVAALRPARSIAVVGHQADGVRAALDGICDTFVHQAEQRGTGHAVLQAEAPIRSSKAPILLIVSGDVPTLRSSTLRALLSRHRRTGAALTLISAEVPDPSGYGRVVRDGQGRVRSIVEHADAGPQEERIREINCGIYCADAAKLLAVLKTIRPHNAQGEYYLTDAVHRLLERGERVLAFRHEDADEVLGVNTRGELVRAGLALYARKAQELLDSGVTLLDPGRTWIDPRARIGRDTVVYPGVIIEGASILGEGCVVGPGARLRDVVAGKDVEIKDHCFLADARLGDGAVVGPFAHFRPGVVLETGAKVGNFVEIKKSRIGKGTKAMHLSYLGDADVGPGCNIGAGTITCNYDGEKKSPTVLGAGVFIGSDTQLVAPVKVGKGAYVAAGTTVTEDVPPGSLAIGRCKQANVEGWVERRRARRETDRTAKTD